MQLRLLTHEKGHAKQGCCSTGNGACSSSAEGTRAVCTVDALRPSRCVSAVWGGLQLFRCGLCLLGSVWRGCQFGTCSACAFWFNSMCWSCLSADVFCLGAIAGQWQDGRSSQQSKCCWLGWQVLHQRESLSVGLCAAGSPTGQQRVADCSCWHMCVVWCWSDTCLM